MAYHIVAIPCYTGLTSSTIKEAAKHTIQTWGGKSLHPTVLNKVVADLKLDDQEGKGAIAYYIFRELILSEHTIGRHYYDHYVRKEDRIIYPIEPPAIHQSPITSYVTSAVNQINECWDKHPIFSTVLKFLVEDLYDAQDNDKLFGYGEGEVPSTIQPTQVAKEIKTITDKYFVEGFATTVAIVVLDAEYNYCGHVYIWPSSNNPGIVEVIGIRSSVINLSCRLLPDITTKLFTGVATWCKSHGFTTIEVLAPMPVVRKMLANLKFIESHEGMRGEVSLLPTTSDYTAYGVNLFERLKVLVRPETTNVHQLLYDPFTLVYQW